MNTHLDVGATLGRVFELYRNHLGKLILVAVVVWVPIGIVLGLVASSDSIFLRLIANLLQFVATFLFAGLVIKIVEADRAGEGEPTLSELFERVGPRLLPLIGISIIAAIGIGIAAIFLVIPALILATYWIALAPIIVVETRRPAFESFGRSIKLVSGNFWRVVLVLLVILLVLIAVFIIAAALAAISAVLAVIGLIALAVLLTPLSALVQSQVYFDLIAANGESPQAVAGDWTPPAAGAAAPPPPAAPEAPAAPPAASPPAAPEAPARAAAAGPACATVPAVGARRRRLLRRPARRAGRASAEPAAAEPASAGRKLSGGGPGSSAGSRASGARNSRLAGSGPLRV